MALLPLVLMTALTSLFFPLATSVAGMPGIASHVSVAGRSVGEQAGVPRVTLTPGPSPDTRLAGGGIRGQAGRAARTLTPSPSPGARERGAEMASMWWPSGVTTADGCRARQAEAPLPRIGRGVGVRVLWRNAAISGQPLPLPAGREERGDDGLPLPAHVWEMDSYTLGDAAPVDIAEPAHYTAQLLPDGQASFRLDCNSGHGAVTASDGDFTLRNLATTDALCPSGSHGDAFVTLLASADRYRFDETGNLILRGTQGALRLRPTLRGVTWEWQGVAANDGTIFVAPPAPERYTLEFQPDGGLAIRADCNRARARARTEGIVMDITVGGVTRMACLPDSLGGPFLVALGDVESWYLFNGTLSLTLPDGAGMMNFTPAVASSKIPPGAE